MSNSTLPTRVITLRERIVAALSSFHNPRPVLRRVPSVMVDLETFDLEPTAAFYAIGARTFKLGERVGDTALDPDNPLTDRQEIREHPEFLQYISPERILADARFTSSADTMRWTMEKNSVEFRRAQDHGRPLAAVLDDFDRWLEYHDPAYVSSNSPNFDHAILRHAYRVTGREKELPPFRTDFDVRTVGHLRYEFGMKRYPAKPKGTRLHSPIDDCTIQINGIAEFVRFIETGEQ